MSPAAPLLGLDEIGDRVAPPRVALGAGDGVAPGRGIVGIAGEELGEARVIEHVVGGQTPNPGESPDVDGKPGARGGVPARARLGVCRGRQT